MFSDKALKVLLGVILVLNVVLITAVIYMVLGNDSTLLEEEQISQFVKDEVSKRTETESEFNEDVKELVLEEVKKEVSELEGEVNEVVKKQEEVLEIKEDDYVPPVLPPEPVTLSREIDVRDYDSGELEARYRLTYVSEDPYSYITSGTTKIFITTPKAELLVNFTQSFPALDGNYSPNVIPLIPGADLSQKGFKYVGDYHDLPFLNGNYEKSRTYYAIDDYEDKFTGPHYVFIFCYYDVDEPGGPDACEHLIDNTLIEKTKLYTN